MLGLLITLYLCICIYVYMCICVFYIWYTGMSYLISLNPKLLKNTAHVGSFKHFIIWSGLRCSRAPDGANKTLTAETHIYAQYALESESGYIQRCRNKVTQAWTISNNNSSLPGSKNGKQSGGFSHLQHLSHECLVVKQSSHFPSSSSAPAEKVQNGC